MKVVITGHTKGIGKSIYEYFKKDLNNIVIGFSKSTLCDISKETDRQIILNELIDTDIFVNNAYHIHDDSQNILLEESYFSIGGGFIVQENINLEILNLQFIQKNGK
jgi:hypothetical protein